MAPSADIGDSTICECGERWDDHYPAHVGSKGLLYECILHGGWEEACDPHRFQPAEREELDGIALSQAVDRRRGF